MSLISAGLVVTLPGVANAASWHNNITGTVWSHSGSWYTSANYRTKDGSSAIGLNFDYRPTQSNGVETTIRWRYIGNSGEVQGGPYDIGNNEYEDTLYMVSGWQFRNSYSRYWTCAVAGCNHNFQLDQLY